MKRAKCQRGWEAEAIEDARLDGLGRASFERHAATCESCAREQLAWSKLRSMVKKLPAPTSTPLERKRLRNTVLSKANHQTFVEARPEWPRRAIVAFVGLAAVITIAVAFKRGSFRTMAAERYVAGPTFEIHPIGSAQWHLERAGAQTEVRLSDGAVAIHVDKVTGTQRFLLMLPDGELEVRGTRFVAEVRDGRTDHVEVAEGTVAIRLGSDETRTLGAGADWRRNDEVAREPAAPTPDDVATDVDPSSVITPARAAPPSTPVKTRATAAGSAKTPPRALGAPLVEPTDRSGRAAAGNAFVEAMTAFEAGSYDRAERLFGEFEQHFPSDARTEDADFMRILTRMRLGDANGAEQRAHAYLARHPKGLRQVEVETFLRRLPRGEDP